MDDEKNNINMTGDPGEEPEEKKVASVNKEEAAPAEDAPDEPDGDEAGPESGPDGDEEAPDPDPGDDEEEDAIGPEPEDETADETGEEDIPPEGETYTAHPAGTPGRVYVISGAIVFGLLLVALLVISIIKGTFNPAFGRIEAFMRRSSTETFPVHVTGRDVYAAGKYDGGALLLSDTALIGFDRKGSEKIVRGVTFDNAAMAVKKDHILVYDRSGTGFALLKGNDSVYEDSAPRSIIDADTGAGGRFAVAMRDNEYKSSVMIYDPVVYGNRSDIEYNSPDDAFDVNLTYRFSEGYVTDVACDEDCRFVGVSVIRADDGVVNSDFYLIDTDEQDDSTHPVISFEKEAIAGAKCLPDGSFFIVTDAAVYRVEGGESERMLTFDSSVMIEFASLDYDSPPAVLLTSYGLKNSNILMIFDKRGRFKSSATVAGRAIGMDSSSKGVAVLFTDKTMTYTPGGRLAGVNYLSESCENILFRGNFLYLQSIDEVKLAPAFTRVQEE